MLVEMEASTTPGTEENFKPQKANAKRLQPVDKCWKWTSKEWILTQPQGIGTELREGIGTELGQVTELREVRRGTPLVLGG